MTGITLLGLGPGDPKYLTCEAREWLETVSELCVIDKRHPVIKEMADSKTIVCLSELSDRGVDEVTSCKRIVDRVMELGSRPDGVTVAITGHPVLDYPCSRQIIFNADNKKMPCHVIAGLRLGDMIATILGLPRQTHFTIMHAGALIKRHVPAFPPSTPVIIESLESLDKAADIYVVLASVYPNDHPIILINNASGGQPELVREKLVDLEKGPDLSEFTSLYIPPLDENSAFENFQEIVARLRAPDGCPWDREQTHLSLRQHLLEESYETLEAIDSSNMGDLCEELGDLLLQIVLNAQIAGENKHFNMAQVIDGISTKIISRHPHVFGDFKVEGVGGVLKNWEKLKEAERQQNGNIKKGLLDGAPASLPALAYSHEIQDRAARVGFDWPGIEGVIAKVHEEFEEVLAAKTDAEREAEIGDLAFAVVNLARWLKVDPESALRGTNKRFKKRFSYIEDTARERGVSLGDLGFEEMDRLWEEAKRKFKK
jgi:tetrapyrrole methylase family protein/MazG family protein